MRHGCFLLAKTASLHNRFIIFIAAIGIFSGSCRASSPFAVSPITNWGPSWAASAAQGTTVALTLSIEMDSEEKDAVLLLIRSPVAVGTSTSAINTNADSERDDDVANATESGMMTEMNGLHVKLLHPEMIIPEMEESKRWTYLGSSVVCCMTGLASDMDHLTRKLQYETNMDRIIYEGSRRQSIIEQVNLLADILQDAVHLERSRPFGIQALLVGGGSQQQPRPCLFTLDPSGGYRHWACATAIGRAASQVRKCLFEILKKEGHPSNAKIALDRVLRATISGLEEASVAIGSEDYQALLVWNDGALRVGIVDPNEVRESQTRIRSKEGASPS